MITFKNIYSLLLLYKWIFVLYYNGAEVSVVIIIYHLASFGLKRENANKNCTIQIILIKNNVAEFLNIATRDLAVQIVVCLKGLLLQRLQGWTE